MTDNLLNKLFGSENRRNPYPGYRKLREHQRVMPLRDDFYLVSGYEEAAEILRTPEFGHGKPPVVEQPDDDRLIDDEGRIIRSFIVLDPPDHTRLRRLVSKAFTPRTVERLASRIDELARELIGKAAEKGEADFVTEVSMPLPVTVIGELLSIPLDERERFAAWSADLARGIDPPYLLEEGVFDRAVRARREFLAYIRELAEERRRRPGDDLLSELLAVSDAGDTLSEGEVLVTITLLLIAGHITTTNLIGNSVLAMLNHPDQFQKLVADRSLAAQAVEEVLRYDSPSQLITRKAQQDTSFAGMPVKEGTETLIVIGGTNRDPEAHENPEVFDITRPPTPHLAFGHGVHFCLGAPLARLEARTLLLALADQPHAIRQAAPETWSRVFTLRGPSSLPVAFE